MRMDGAQILGDFKGFSGASASLARPPETFFSTKLKPLGSIGQDETVIVYGDEATPDFTDSIDVVFGDAEPAAWDSLQTGYSYIWNVGNKNLVIKNADGVIVTARKITAWSDLCISAEVLESHQFTYIIDGSYTPNAFLLATRQMSMRKSSVMAVCWGEFEKTLTTIFHVVYTRVEGWLKEEAGTMEYENMGAIARLQSFIKATIGDLSQSALFPQNLYLASKNLAGKPIKVNKSVLIASIGKYLMVYTISATLLLGDKDCYEPWMLWEMFKWLQKSRYVEVEETIFDLSPNWGA